MRKVNLFSLQRAKRESEWNEPDRNKWKQNATLSLNHETMIKNPSIDIIYSLLLWSILDYKFVWLSSSHSPLTVQCFFAFFIHSRCCLSNLIWWFSVHGRATREKRGEKSRLTRQENTKTRYKFSDFWFRFVSQFNNQATSREWNSIYRKCICNIKYRKYICYKVRREGERKRKVRRGMSASQIERRKIEH